MLAEVDKLADGSDVAALAEMLARMRRSLAVVQDLPEFHGGQRRLEVRSVRRELLR